MNKSWIYFNWDKQLYHVASWVGSSGINSYRKLL